MSLVAKQLHFRWLDRISEVPPSLWNGVVGNDCAPTLRWQWISALEQSGSVSEQSGYQPTHLTVWDGDLLIGATPAYVKLHSMGEYIYDFAWAQTAARMGIRYYPKLMVGVPLAPITSTKLNVARGYDAGSLRPQMIEALLRRALALGCSSIHILFTSASDEEYALAAPFFKRTTMQFHWKNEAYASYDDFLARFDSKRRSQLKRERSAAANQGIHIRTIAGSLCNAEHARIAHRLYASTVEKNGFGMLQLNEQFFSTVFAELPENVELVVAERGNQLVAGAFNLVTPARLYGRYWGCVEEVPFLHFNVCLYHSVDACIQAGRQVFEPGAGGEHKIQRGFQPTAVNSWHALFDDALARRIRAAVDQEAAHVKSIVANSAELSGFRRPPSLKRGSA